jgi:Rieske Fe-S protein
MTSATIAAIINSDLILGKANPWSKLYNPDRKNIRAFNNYFQVMFNIAKQIIGSLFQPSGEIDKLEKDSGTVVTNGLKKTAVYKDTSGKLHKYSAVCTHMGCIVDWNGAEKTWDCPCHGSRFDSHGKVVKGPANTDLPKED